MPKYYRQTLLNSLKLGYTYTTYKGVAIMVPKKKYNSKEEIIAHLTSVIENTGVFTIVDSTYKDNYGVLLFKDSDNQHDIASFIVEDGEWESSYFLSSKEHFTKIPKDWLDKLHSHSQVEFIIQMQGYLEPKNNPESLPTSNPMLTPETSFIREAEIDKLMRLLYINSYCEVAESDEELFNLVVQAILNHEHYSKYVLKVLPTKNDLLYISLVGKPIYSF